MAKAGGLRRLLAVVLQWLAAWAQRVAVSLLPAAEQAPNAVTDVDTGAGPPEAWLRLVRGHAEGRTAGAPYPDRRSGVPNLTAPVPSAKSTVTKPTKPVAERSRATPAAPRLVAEPRPVAEPTEIRPVAEPTETRPVAEPAENRPVADLTETRTVAEPAETRPVDEPTEAGSVAEPTEPGLVAEPAEPRPGAERNETRPVDEPTETRPVAELRKPLLRPAESHSRTARSFAPRDQSAVEPAGQGTQPDQEATVLLRRDRAVDEPRAEASAPVMAGPQDAPKDMPHTWGARVPGDIAERRIRRLEATTPSAATESDAQGPPPTPAAKVAVGDIQRSRSVPELMITPPVPAVADPRAARAAREIRAAERTAGAVEVREARGAAPAVLADLVSPGYGGRAVQTPLVTTRPARDFFAPLPPVNPLGQAFTDASAVSGTIAAQLPDAPVAMSTDEQRDPWPELPDDRAMWTPASGTGDQEHLRRLAREQRGE